MTRSIVSVHPIQFEGWSCVRATNETVDIVVPCAFGPRVMRYGLVGRSNVFQVMPATRGRIARGNWSPYGGHRLWAAPEKLPYPADNDPVAVEHDGHSMTVTGTVEEDGLEKSMRISFESDEARVHVMHRITNRSENPRRLAPWALSVVANGGHVAIPHDPFVSHDDDLLPARPLVLWKFTNMSDPRWTWGKEAIILRENAAMPSPQKVGCFNRRGWAAHYATDHVFTIRIDTHPEDPALYADMGCNFETYTAGAFQELETLGPLVLLAAGDSVWHQETWEVKRLRA